MLMKKVDNFVQDSNKAGIPLINTTILLLKQSCF
jgi:hypothetical protein